jgi:hypothetical protein
MSVLRTSAWFNDAHQVEVEVVWDDDGCKHAARFHMTPQQAESFGFRMIEAAKHAATEPNL